MHRLSPAALAFFFGLLVAILSACDSSDDTDAGTGLADTLLSDGEASDTASDAGESDTGESDTTVGDAMEPDTDGGGDEPPALPEIPAAIPLHQTCDLEVPEAKTWPMDAKKFSLSIYHYNVQYVAGGLDNYLGIWTASDEEIQDLIIVESFEPVVALYEKHPDWGGSFEMQGLMLEIMAQRHTDILERFYKLVKRGQVDLMTYHWSDQLVTAYPRKDMEWSWAENRRLLDELCLEKAPIHFLQEGQYGPGIAKFAHDMDGDMVVVPRNLLALCHDEPRPQGMWFDNHGYRTLVTNGYSEGDYALNWNFVDDGELVATGKVAPYLLSEFKYNPTEFAKYEQKLQDLADDGYLIAPISHYLKVMEADQVPVTTIDPPVPDGSWQPGSSHNMRIWMGWYGQIPGGERDNLILTNNVTLRQRLTAIEYLLSEVDAAGVDVTEAQAVFRHAVRELLLAEVSDSTGWRPTDTEVAYSLDRHAVLFPMTEGLAAWALWHLNERGERVVDPVEKTITEPVEPQAGTPLSAPPEGLEGVMAWSERTADTSWADFGDYVELTITFAAGDPVADTESPPPVQFSVPLEDGNIVYCPAVAEDTLFPMDITAYAFGDASNPIGLPLPNGLLQIASDWTLVLDQQTLHVTALLTPTSVTFEDSVSPSNELAQWRIRFYPAPASEVMPAANRLNVAPPVTFAGP